MLAGWFNDPEVTQYLASYLPVTVGREEQWVADLANKKEDVVFLMVLKDGDVPIGTTGLHRISLPNRNAAFGIAIGEKRFWNQGLGTEATWLVAKFGFDTLNLHRIELSVYEFNARGMRAYEKVGFRKEGCRRQAAFRDGRYWDVFDMGLLAEEFRLDLFEEASGRAGESAWQAADPKEPRVLMV